MNLNLRHGGRSLSVGWRWAFNMKIWATGLYLASVALRNGMTRVGLELDLFGWMTRAICHHIMADLFSSPI
jgi:hypothetical protein